MAKLNGPEVSTQSADDKLSAQSRVDDLTGSFLEVSRWLRNIPEEFQDLVSQNPAEVIAILVEFAHRSASLAQHIGENALAEYRDRLTSLEPSITAEYKELQLSQREVETLVLVEKGYSNSAIGRELLVTEQTVKFHLTNIFRKLKVENRTEAARKVRELGIGESVDVSEKVSRLVAVKQSPGSRIRTLEDALGNATSSLSLASAGMMEIRLRRSNSSQV